MAPDAATFTSRLGLHRPKAKTHTFQSAAIQLTTQNTYTATKGKTQNGYAETNVETPDTSLPIVHQLQDEIRSKDDEIRKMEGRWELEVETILAQKADAEQNNERLLATVQHLENARREREADSKDLKESQFRHFHKQLWDLEQENQKLQRVFGFFDKIPTIQHRSLTQSEIEEVLERIRSELESMLHGVETTEMRLFTPVTMASDLKMLVESSLGNSGEYQTPESRVHQCISDFHPALILRSIALAALRDWVFSLDYPNFCLDGMSSALLKCYRNIAMTCGSWATLRNYDTAAYSELINSDLFKEDLVPRKATRLADRLIDALAPMLIQPARATAHNGPTSSNDPFEIFEGLRFRFIEMFKAALQFKAVTALTDHQYEFVVHRPGTSFQDGRIYSSPRTFNQSARSRATADIDHWLHATFNIYESAPPNILDPQADAIIQTRNFTSNEAQTRPCKLVDSKAITIKKTEHTIAFSSPHDRRPALDSISTTYPCARQIETPRDPSAQSQKSTSPLQPKVPNFLAQTGFDDEDRELSEVISVADLEQNQEEVPSLQPPDKRTQALSIRTSAPSTTDNRCTSCGTQLSSKHCLQRHMQDKSCRRCSLCGKILRSNAHLNDHQRAQHPGSTQQCTQINLEVANTKTSGQKCDKCGLTFTRKKLLTNHKKSRTCSKCARCKITFCNRDELRRHLKRQNCQKNVQAHPNSDRTQQALETRESTPAFSDQITVHSKGGPVTLRPSEKLECTICNVTFTKKWSLGVHLTRKCHTDRVQPGKTSTKGTNHSAELNEGNSHPQELGQGQGSASRDTTDATQEAERTGSRGGPELRREPTPNSRHIVRMVAAIDKCGQKST